MLGYMEGKTILRVCSAGLYKAQYQKFFVEQALDKLSYEQALQKLRDDGFLYPSGFRRQMQTRGYRVVETVADFRPLQEMWVRDTTASVDSNLTDIFLEQVKTWKPDIIYFQELDVLGLQVRRSLKSTFPFIKVVTGFKGFPPKNYEDYQDLDFIFIPYPAFESQWHKAGITTYSLPHCFDPGDAHWDRFREQRTIRPKPAVFVGSSGYGNANQQGRYELLRELLASTPLEVWGLEQPVHIAKLIIRSLLLRFLSSLPRSVLLRLQTAAGLPVANVLVRESLLVKEGKLPLVEWYIDKKPLRDLFPKHVHEAISGVDYLTLLSEAQLALNIHTDVPGEAGNIRMFEVTGVGTCLLVDRRQGLEELFSEDEILLYDSVDDCKRKIQDLLNNPGRALEIARRGHKRTWLSHTSEQRCQVIAEVLGHMLAE